MDSSDSGVMDQIRELLSQGLSAPEIIRRGYASSTVYRVQRETRRKLVISEAYPSGPGRDHLSRLVAENQRLHRRLEGWLAEVVRKVDAGPLGDQVASLQQLLEKVAVAQDQLSRELGVARGKIDQMDGDLDDLAKMYADDRLWGIGKPQWQRRSG